MMTDIGPPSDIFRKAQWMKQCFAIVTMTYMLCYTVLFIELSLLCYTVLFIELSLQPLFLHTGSLPPLRVSTSRNTRSRARIAVINLNI